MSEIISNNESENDAFLSFLSDAELAATGLSRVTSEQEEPDSDLAEYSEDMSIDSDDQYPDDDQYDDDQYDDEPYYDDDYDYSAYDEYGEERANFDEEKIVLKEIPIPKEILERFPFLSKLPHGIAVMGGVSRSIAREILTGDREPIRDIDLVNIENEDGTSNVDYETIIRFSQEYMPDDYAFGHGIETETIKHYFGTRDFTINQTLIMDGKLIISDLAIDDFRENIIRPTYYEKKYQHEPLSHRIILKALMMHCVLTQVTSSIPCFEDIEAPDDEDEPSDFNIALFLNKAMSRNAETAIGFTKELVDAGFVSDYYDGRPIALAKALIRSLYSFKFRPSTDKRFIDIADCDDMDGFFIPQSMQEYHSSDPVVRKEMRLYEDRSASKITDPNYERQTGQYTKEEFDAINED